MEVIFCGDEKCIICGMDIYDEDHLCTSCRNRIMICRYPKQIEHDGLSIKCYSASYYSKVVRELIIRLKYKKDYGSGEILAALMVNTVKENELKPDYITFVPASENTIKKRGYNQSMLLAKLLARQLGFELIDVLEKSSNARDQIGLGKKERFDNIKGTFKLKTDLDIRNKSILLVDDVITTGATAVWCSQVLIKNGAKEVIVLTAAKSKV